MLQSKFLRDNLKNIQLLMTIPVLQKFETENLGRLLRLSRMREYEAGEVIIREGDEDQWLYFLLSGGVRVQKEGVIITRIKKMGEIFGEMRIVDRQARSATVIAEEKTLVLAVDTAAHERFGMEDEKARFLILLYRIFAEYTSARLRLTNQELIKAKQLIDNLKTASK